VLAVTAGALAGPAAAKPHAQKTSVTVSKEPFGALPDGRAIERYALRNGRMTVRILTYGASSKSSGRRTGAAAGRTW
jgi:hypothetical protein